MQHLVVLDVPGIKEYVFGTNRLVQIRGASALLDHLNRRDTETKLRGWLGKDKVRKIFANGGAGQFILDSPLQKVEETLQALKGHFYRETRGGVRLVCGVMELSSGSYDNCLSGAFLALKKEKEESSFPETSHLHTGYLRECDTCSGPAVNDPQGPTVLYGEERLVLCASCRCKLAKGKERGLWGDFSDFLVTKGVSPEQADAYRPWDFQEIGDRCLKPPGYTALVYADGNAMGRLVKEITTPEDFEDFSTTVDESIRQACHEALLETCLLPRGPIEGKIPADILLLGGDDLIVYLSADTALPFALAVAEKFERKTQERFSKHKFFRGILKNKGVTISLGIAIGRSQTPFAMMLEQAKELLRLAKAEGAKLADGLYAPAYLDYHFTSSYNQVHVQDCRRSHFHQQWTVPLRLTQKPYSLDNLRELFNCARELIQSGIPRTRLHRLGYAPTLGKMNGTLEFLNTYIRTSQNEQKGFIQKSLDLFGCAGMDIPWKEEEEAYSTILLDLVELTDLISMKEA